MGKAKARLLTAVGLVSLLALTACSGSGDDDSGSSGGGSSISCADIAGNYTMNFRETSCDGKPYQGTVSGTVTADCNVGFTSNLGTTITGTFTARTATTIAGHGETSYCGGAYLVCSSKMNSCEYTHDKGGGGKLW